MILEQAESSQGRSHCIPDSANSLDEVVSALMEAELEGIKLIFAIDFTRSNLWTGMNSFNRRSLHEIGSIPNPYEQAISIIGRTLAPFVMDNFIYCFGFGDASTQGKDIFNFFPDGRPCHGIDEALGRYKEIVASLELSAPTSFAPIIDASTDIVERSNGQYHVLIIFSDGQVTRENNLQDGELSPQEKATINSIVEASQYPLSIILVGVGDGPWQAMQQIIHNIPEYRPFDNFEFVEFTKIMSEQKNEAAFALAALKEIPSQYKVTQKLMIVESGREEPRTKPIPPPPSEETECATTMVEVCPICFINPRDMAFGCGHLTCKECGVDLQFCPLCRQPITGRLRLYP
ncbi:E3 ubiquitin-protein ligase RGLG3-like [Macadamia integrifolia]|uniref:E3 ubiquitin-protein ligase RGLG3-like n=1 Tax=Macadamia integrifolia TaxID=60698 RepID=UPI001C4F1017|nr:E3 ubiquitin-protein ligase RGLG3-like [Macadamia integrifolia]